MDATEITVQPQLDASLAVINVTQNREVEIFSGGGGFDLPREEEEEPASRREEEGLPEESKKEDVRSGGKRIEHGELFSADELENFAELLPSSAMPQPHP